MKTKNSSMRRDADRLAQVLATHFDPKWGTPYWLEQRPHLGFDPLSDVRDEGGLGMFPPFPQYALAERPIEDFIPRKYHDRLAAFITSESGGTTGPPKRTAYLPDEFHAAFVAPFLAAAALLRFPRQVHWLFIGPSGPHIIGKAARACATAMGSVDPFMVDFDPRWARRLAPSSMARQRYIQHVVDQAMAVLRSQHIGVLFTTPPIVEALATRMEDADRKRIQGLHLGGIRATEIFWKSVGTDWFPNAVVMSGYGNSLVGMLPQLILDDAHCPVYFGHGARLCVGLNDNQPGRVVLHRLDESAFLPNLVERDEAETAVLPERFAGNGFHLVGLRDPRPPIQSASSLREGLY